MHVKDGAVTFSAIVDWVTVNWANMNEGLRSLEKATEERRLDLVLRSAGIVTSF